jgi:thiamine-phosphate pyrophosphorylase
VLRTTAKNATACRLYGIVDNSAAPGRTHLEIAAALLGAGVGVLQLRDKAASDAELRRSVEELLPLVRAAGAELILNDRLDLATEFEGVGVHLGQADADPSEARRKLGADALIGWSTHDLLQVEAAQSLPLDYLGFGPIFSATGKHLSPGDERAPMGPRGTTNLAEAVRTSALPIVAIGGINEVNLDDVLRTGVQLIAAISTVTQAQDMLATVTSLEQRCRARRPR